MTTGIEKPLRIVGVQTDPALDVMGVGDHDRALVVPSDLAAATRTLVDFLLGCSEFGVEDPLALREPWQFLTAAVSPDASLLRIALQVRAAGEGHCGPRFWPRSNDHRRA
jgi:hypothetical protein